MWRLKHIGIVATAVVGILWFQVSLGQPTILRESVENPAETYFKQGQELEKQGEKIAAIAIYREAIRLNGNVAQYYFHLGKALEGRMDLDDALAAYREAVRLKPDSERYRAALAEALVLQELLSSDRTGP